MAVTPRSLFSSDGCPLVPKDKSSFMHAVEEASLTEDVEDAPDVEDVEEDDSNESSMKDDDLLFSLDVDVQFELPNIDICENVVKVIIFDGMAVLQSMKKTQSMKKIMDLGEQFIKRIRRLMKGYSEGRVLFDQYFKTSLKNNTRRNRGNSNDIIFQIHDDMNIVKLQLKEILSSSSTKAQLTEYLSLKLLDSFKNDEQSCGILWGQKRPEVSLT